MKTYKYHVLNDELSISIKMAVYLETLYVKSSRIVRVKTTMVASHPCTLFMTNSKRAANKLKTYQAFLKL